MAKHQGLAQAHSVAVRGVQHRLARRTVLWLSVFGVMFEYFFLRYVVLKLPVIPPYTVGLLTFTTFGPLVAMGICFGIHLTHRWCLRFALDWPAMQEGMAWVLSAGFVVAHLLAIGESSLANLLNPRELLAVRAEFSSFGGFLGSTMAALYFCRKRALPVRPVIDGLLYGFIGGWLFGRLGCFSVHDHPGVVTGWPTGVLIRGALRHDLGFYELVYTLILFTVITMVIRTRKRFDGFIIAVTATSYPLVRFCLDFLRLGDSTYAGLTLAQWGCLPLFALGVYIFLSGWNRYAEARPCAPTISAGQVR